MLKPKGWGVFMLLVTTMLCITADNFEALAESKDSRRTETWELTIPVRYLSGQTIDFEHGSSLDLHSDLGWGFGFSYNMSEHVNLGMEFAWTTANYTVNYVSADDPPGPPGSASGTLDLASTQINFTYYFMPKTLTPYVSAGIGWNWIDTNIPSGPPASGCWWDPWYGYVCSSYQTTFSDTAFAYGIGAGVRIEPKEGFFLRLGLNDNWQDLGGLSETPDFLSYRLDLGWKF